MSTETHLVRREWGILAAILVAIVLPPIGFVWAFSNVIRLRHHPRTQRPLAVDEVQSGYARTGRFFATEWTSATPDIVIMAKGIASGLPLSGLLAARTLLDTYIGAQSGGRVLDGQIRRGMGETIRAVIWLCDLRGFTALSEALPRETLIDLLNGYFGPMCDAVMRNGGEVLKFIGDAMLAIFPVGDDTPAACARALAAAQSGVSRRRADVRRQRRKTRSVWRSNYRCG